MGDTTELQKENLSGKIEVRLGVNKSWELEKMYKIRTTFKADRINWSFFVIFLKENPWFLWSISNNNLKNWGLKKIFRNLSMVTW